MRNNSAHSRATDIHPRLTSLLALADVESVRVSACVIACVCVCVCEAFITSICETQIEAGVDISKATYSSFVTFSAKS